VVITPWPAAISGAWPLFWRCSSRWWQARSPGATPGAATRRRRLQPPGAPATGPVTTGSGATITTVAIDPNQLYPAADTNNKWGFVDRTGAWVIQPKWDFVDTFKEGLARVATGEVKTALWGFIDTTGKEIGPIQYAEVGRFSDGLAKVRMKADGKMGYVDTTGALVIPLQFGSAGTFADGLAVVATDTEGKRGFIDKTGKFVIPETYAGAGSFSDGLAAVSLEKEAKWGYIDKTGAVVVKAQFDAVSDFSEGLAVAGSAAGGKLDEKGSLKYGLIDTTGAWVAQPTFSAVYPFSEGFARVAYLDADGNSSVGFVDKTGKVVLTSSEWTPTGDFSEGLAAVMANNMYGYIDTTGAYVLPPKYDHVESFSGGLARVIATGSDPAEFGYIDRTGAIVFWNNPAKQPKWSGGTTSTTAAK
jgi:hypothetical protein